MVSLGVSLGVSRGVSGGADGVRILALSDVALGYGTPQVGAAVRSILDVHPGATAWIVEPDQKDRPQRSPPDPRVRCVRLGTRLPPYDRGFQVEAALLVRELMTELRPDIVMIAHAWMAPGVLRAPAPNVLIYYMLESLSHQVQGIGEEAAFLNRLLLERADVVLTPERRRLAADLRTLKLERPDAIEVYNASARPDRIDRPQAERRRAVFYGGSIGEQTLCRHFLDPRLEHVSFEIAGAASDAAGQRLVQELSGRRNIRYLGLLPNDKLRALRRGAMFSTVMWNPTDANQLYASPNKLFESIADGVPVVVAPHPQCVEVVDRHGCGLIMEDWSVDAFVHALADALKRGADAYAGMVGACWRAAEGPLCWEAQFAPVIERLKARSPG